MPEPEWTDPIVEEVRRIRDAHAAKFNYDLKAICADLRRRQRESGRQFVTLPAKRISDSGESEGAA